MKRTKQYIFVANWKMYLNFQESVSFCTTNKSEISTLANQHKIIFLPSFISLNTIATMLQNTGAFYGAQNVSEFESGAYTGEVSAKMLADIGCFYCLVGHQERRTYFHEIDEQIAKKLQLLIDVGITPILCVGEQERQYDLQIVKQIVEKQLMVLEKISYDQQLLVAYEPGWHIGASEKSFDEKQIEHIEQVIQFLVSYLNAFKEVKLLYGGSVNQYSIQTLLDIKEFDGFLIGASSTNFFEFQSIIAQCS